MSQGNMTRYEGAEGKGMSKTQILHVVRRCGKAQGCQRRHKMWLGTGVSKTTQDVARNWGAEGDTKLACSKAMWLGIRVPKVTKSLHVARRCA
ncbi:unnamed protein product [Prunus armeniaca]